MAHRRTEHYIILYYIILYYIALNPFFLFTSYCNFAHFSRVSFQLVYCALSALSRHTILSLVKTQRKVTQYHKAI